MTETATPKPPVAAEDRDRLFRTDHLHADLKGRSIRGGAVTVFAQAVKFVLNMGSTAVLARLLTPADFGLIAMVAAFTGFVGLFKDMGLSMATVQQTEITHEQVSTLFWINVALSLVLACICAALAPVVAWFYSEPRLVQVTLAISATFAFGGLAAQHAALLQRQMRFQALATIDVASTVCGIGTAIMLAMMGARYWALVAMIAAQSVVGMGGMWLASGWWPGLIHRQGGVLPMLKFGSNLTGFNILNYLTRNFDNLLIGAFLGAEPLGIYSKAYNLLMMPIRQISSPMGAVALPALCRLQNDPVQYRRYCLKALEITALCGMPLVAFAFTEAEDLILTVLGPQWAGAVPIFRWLAPAAFLGTLGALPVWLCNSLGQSHRLFRWAIFATPITIAAFAIGLRWGPAGVAAGFSITWCTLLVVLTASSCAGSPVRMRDIGLRLWHPVLASLIAASVTAAASPLFAPLGYPATRATLAACLFGAVFIGIYIVQGAGRRALGEFLSVATRLRP